MKENNKGLTIVSTVIIFVILVVLIGVGIKFIFGEDGAYTKAVKTDFEYDKGEVLESLQTFISEFFLKGYNEVNDSNFHLIPDEVIDGFFNGWNKDNGEGEEWKAEKSLFLDGPEKKADNKYGFDIEDGKYRCYIVRIDSLKRQIAKYGKGTSYEEGDVFVVRREITGHNEEDNSEIFGEGLELIYKPAEDDPINKEIIKVGDISFTNPVK